jgi:hypothetical protein
MTTVEFFDCQQVYRKHYIVSNLKVRFTNCNHFADHKIFENFSIMKNLSDPLLLFGEELFIKNLSFKE